MAQIVERQWSAGRPFLRSATQIATRTTDFALEFSINLLHVLDVCAILDEYRSEVCKPLSTRLSVPK